MALRRTLRLATLLLVTAALVLGVRAFLAAHPQHDPWAPLDLRAERGWATQVKLSRLDGDTERCHAVLSRSEVGFNALPAAGEGACLRDDRLTLDTMRFAPRFPEMSCQVAVGMVLWLEQDVQRLAQQILGTRVERVEQLGTYNCRRMYGDVDAPWSEHATGNAIDIAGFQLADGRRISVLRDWDNGAPAGQFLQAVRDAACTSFGTVLSPDYNAAHADHFHFDQGRSPVFGTCR